ncbi:MAG: branched-chain amino acid ABC transporter permease, partial [Thermodesulfobacteriota bacterium]|nr:branched-chain amino acid ABC transporter permease [Thermodesulfobacteriota bacterium]
GNAIRTVAEDREIANLMGINVTRIYLITMGISIALAGLGGAIVAPIYTVNPLMWMQPLIVVLASVVLGGLGSIKGSIIAAFVLGFAETAVVFLIPDGSFLRGAVSLTIMVVVLQLRPEGLYGVVFEEERL